MDLSKRRQKRLQIYVITSDKKRIINRAKQNQSAYSYDGAFDRLLSSSAPALVSWVQIPRGECTSLLCLCFCVVSRGTASDQPVPRQNSLQKKNIYKPGKWSDGWDKNDLRSISDKQQICLVQIPLRIIRHHRPWCWFLSSTDQHCDCNQNCADSKTTTLTTHASICLLLLLPFCWNGCITEQKWHNSRHYHSSSLERRGKATISQSDSGMRTGDLPE